MTEETVAALVVIVAVAVIAPFVADRVRTWIAIPVVVTEILLGILVGPAVLDLVKVTEGDVISALSDLGLAFLMFLAGYEIDFARIKGRPLRLSVLGWLISLLLGVGIAVLLASSEEVGLVLGLALTTTALGTILPILRDRRPGSDPVRIACSRRRRSRRVPADPRHRVRLQRRSACPHDRRAGALHDRGLHRRLGLRGAPVTPGSLGSLPRHWAQAHNSGCGSAYSWSSECSDSRSSSAWTRSWARSSPESWCNCSSLRGQNTKRRRFCPSWRGSGSATSSRCSSWSAACGSIWMHCSPTAERCSCSPCSSCCSW